MTVDREEEVEVGKEKGKGQLANFRELCKVLAQFPKG